ncbi:LruC domain-containing protein [Thalassomonas actiniarum]|nr:LruC domain-containing protein [Thalassomonas actiniarum]
MMYRLLLMLLTFIIITTGIRAAPFSHCPSKAFLFQGKPVSSYGVNLVTGNYDLIEDNPGINANVNGVGFNETDRYLYGFNTTYFQLVRLGSDFQIQTLNLSGLPAQTTFYVGDVANHVYYLYRKNTGFYKVDLSPLDSDSNAQLTAELITAQAGVRLTDFAFHPKDKKLYGVDNSSGVLYQFNPDNGSTLAIGDTGETGTFGAVYFDVNGYFYLSRNQDGQIYRINLSALTENTSPAELAALDVAAIKFADGPSSNQNDGARCASAPLIDTDTESNIDFGDAPASYGTTLADNGARHLLDGETYLGLAAPDGDYDGYTGSDSDDSSLVNGQSYDDEDGVNFVTALETGLDAVVRVYAANNGVLNAWFDWNRDGDFNDENEQAFTDIRLTAGFNNLALRVPDNAIEGGSWSRFRFSQQTGLSYSGGSSSGEVEDHAINISRPDISYRHYPGESSWVTLAYEDKWPQTDDYDMNDVVFRYRTTEVIREGRVIRIDISGKLQALGAEYHSGFAIQLPNIASSNVNPVTLRLLHNNIKQAYSGTNGADTYEILESGTSNAVIVVSQDLWQHASSICRYFRSEMGCNQPVTFDFQVSVPLITPVPLSEMPAPPYDPFIFGTPGLYHGDIFSYQPGRELEIHLADHPPTEKFNPGYFGLADDTSDAASGRYYRNANNLPWALEVVEQWQWPSERKTILQAYPQFRQFAESKGRSATSWFDSSQSDSQYLFH